VHHSSTKQVAEVVHMIMPFWYDSLCRREREGAKEAQRAAGFGVKGFECTQAIVHATTAH
jgi:hypothetical protein